MKNFWRMIALVDEEPGRRTYTPSTLPVVDSVKLEIQAVLCREDNDGQFQF